MKSIAVCVLFLGIRIHPLTQNSVMLPLFQAWMVAHKCQDMLTNQTRQQQIRKHNNKSQKKKKKNHNVKANEKTQQN